MRLDVPFGWSEDFGHFTASAKGALFGLGAGESHPALHNPDYDFPDELIAAGVELFGEILHRLTGPAE
jgi:metal-dependent amidase/aminoacylase/carboxypeptidase family protein